MQNARATALLFVLTLSIVSSTAYAQTSSPRERALELFKEAKSRYESGDFTRAVELLKRAYELEPSPVLMFNLGRAYESSGDLAHAIESYRRYLEIDPHAKDHGAITQRIETLERQLDERERLGKERDEAARRAQHAERDRDTGSSQPPDRREPQNSGPGILPWIVVGGGAAFLAAGATFGYLARRKSDHAEDPGTSASRAEDDVDQGKRFATIANVGFVAGGVLVAGGLTWWLVSPKSSGTSRVGVGIGPSGARISGRF